MFGLPVQPATIKEISPKANKCFQGMTGTHLMIFAGIV